MVAKIPRKKSDVIWGWAAAVSGVVDVLLFAALLLSGEMESTGDTLLSMFFIIFGCAVALFGALLIKSTSGGYVRLEDGRLTARFGLLRRLDCPLSDIEEIALYPMRTAEMLAIYMKSGKIISISGLVGAGPLCAAAGRLIDGAAGRPVRDAGELRAELALTGRKRARTVTAMIALYFVSMLAIALTVTLTGGRELNGFSGRDWAFAGVGMTLVLGLLAAVFILAAHCSKLNVSALRTSSQLREAVITATPLLPGNVTAVYTDPGYSGRFTVFGYPGSPELYYKVEVVDGSYELKETYCSPVMSDRSEIDKIIPELRDMTARFI